MLVIDEVSMVRADMLDATDVVLRHIRRNSKPFGGVQVLFIGDLCQLPPVVKDDEWEVLSTYYKSMFFFDAIVMKDAQPVCIELTTIHRQRDEHFIHMLNAIRNNVASEEDFKALNKHYDPSFYPEADDGYIILTSHNYKADKINDGNLAKLPSELVRFEGELEGEFNEQALPAARTLSLKAGAQIMFIRNDKGENRRFYNGKIGIINRIRNGEIWVRFPGEAGELLVEKETWRNIRYEYSEAEDRVKEHSLGTYTQYPLRLAWAVTIHKSQGLTFEKAIIDAAQSFAPGQVYVALSRLTSLNGLVLSSPISAAAIHTEARIQSWNAFQLQDEDLMAILSEAQEEFLHEQITRSFHFDKMLNTYQELRGGYDAMRLPHMAEAIEWCTGSLQNLQEISKVSEKFGNQLSRLLSEAGDVGYVILADRIVKARDYFRKELEEKLIKPLEQHIKESEIKKGTKKYLGMLGSIRAMLYHHLEYIQSMTAVVSSVASGNGMSQAMQIMNIPKSPPPAMENTGGADVKRPKEDTKMISLRMFRDGKMVEEIARDRGLTVGTIEGHLLHFLPTGEVKLSDIVSPQQEAAIRKYVEEQGIQPAGTVRAALGEEYSYSAIRAVLTQIDTEKSWK